MLLQGITWDRSSDAEKNVHEGKKNVVTTEASMEGAVYELTFKWDFETMNRFRTVS